MRLIVLSDHVADMRAARQAPGRRTAGEYQRELAAHRKWVAEAVERRDLARRRRRPISWLWWAIEARRRRRAAAPAPPSAARRQADAELGALDGGAEGEREVADVLNQTLGKDWTLFKGYRNARGEIDYLILGPAGLFAVEVKYVNGTFRITPTRWSYVKIDRYGIAHEEHVLADAGDRPPHRQLGEPARQLEDFLARRGHPAQVQPVVLLNHPRAKIGFLDESVGVPVLTSTRQLAALVLEGGGNLSAGDLTEITSLIERDHRFHDRRGRG
jgi:nuclease-like protein